MHFVFWGDGSQSAMDLVDAIQVRSTDNFNWTFIFILAVVFYVYWTEIHNKKYDMIFAGLALYGDGFGNYHQNIRARVHYMPEEIVNG